MTLLANLASNNSIFRIVIFNIFSTFECLEDFLAALEECVYKNPDTRHRATDWKDRMVASYNKFYNTKIDIPRWYDIKSKYIKEKSTKRTTKFNQKKSE